MSLFKHGCTKKRAADGHTFCATAKCRAYVSDPDANATRKDRILWRRDTLRPIRMTGHNTKVDVPTAPLARNCSENRHRSAICACSSEISQHGLRRREGGSEEVNIQTPTRNSCLVLLLNTQNSMEYAEAINTYINNMVVDICDVWMYGCMGVWMCWCQDISVY